MLGPATRRGHVHLNASVAAPKTPEEALRESRERLQAALDGSGAGTFRWDIQTDALEWDENLDRLFGLSPGKTVRSLDKFIETVHPDERGGVIAACRRCALEGVDFDLEFRVVWPDGTVRWLSDKGRTFLDDDGRPAYMTGMCVDVTERRRLHDRYRALVEATGNIVWTNTAEGEMRGPQPGWCAYTGQTESEVQGYGWSNAVHPDDAQATIDAWRIAVETRTTFRFEHRVRGRDGTYRWFAIGAVPVLEPSGEIREWVGLSRDVDEQKRADLRLRDALAEVERANHAKDEFLAMLGHELRNPLSPIVTAVQVVKMKGGATREVTVLERQTQHLTRLVDDLLDVSRITRGKVELRKERLDLGELVSAAIETASHRFENARQSLTTTIAPDLALEADRTRMAQVLDNLLANAAKYTPPEGHIAISAQREGKELVLEVRDDGVGISAELLPHVFDLFVQARQTLERAEGGLGLGLAIVKSLVAMHGGTVEAHSEGVGMGARFVVRVPAATTESARGEAREVPSPSSNGARERVLLVDDNEDGAEMLSIVLDAFGYETSVAHDGPSALRLAKDVHPRIALLDIGLPIMDGYELAGLLRQQHPDVFMVAITGYGLESDRKRTREAGFQAHLTKPVDIDRLQSLLEQRR